MKDVIRMVGMQFYGYHGVTAAEKETGHVFEVDCEIKVDLASAGHSDNLSDTIDYNNVYTVIKDMVEGTAFSLLEGLANQLATIILDKFPVYGVTLKVRKINPPISGLARFIEVEVTRFQGNTDKLAATENQENQ